MMRRGFCLIAVLISAAFVPLSAGDEDKDAAAKPRTVQLESILGKDCRSLQKIRKDNCMPTAGGDKTFTSVLMWASPLKREAVYPGLKNAPQPTLFGRDVLQMRLQFQSNKLEGLYAQLFAVGKKTTALKTEDFTALWKSLANEFVKFAGGKCYLSCEVYSGGIEVARLLCIRDHLLFELKSRYSEINHPAVAQYIEFSIRPVETEDFPSIPDVTLKSVFELSGKDPEPVLIRTADKCVYLAEAPMTPALAGIGNEAVVLDQFNRMTGSEPTSLSAISQYLASVNAVSPMNWDAVRLAGSKFDLRLSDVYDRYKDVKNFEKLLDRYNRAAQKMRSIRLDPVYIPTGREWDPYKRIYRERLVLDVVATSAKMQPSVLRQMWLMEKNDFKRFQKTVRTNIDKGLPVGWCAMLPEEVSFDNDGLRKGRKKRDYRAENKTDLARNMLGWIWPGADPVFGRTISFSATDDVVPNPLTANGELRLIIGYNTAQDLIFYLNPRIPDRIFSVSANLAWAVTSFYFIVRDKK